MTPLRCPSDSHLSGPGGAPWRSSARRCAKQGLVEEASRVLNQLAASRVSSVPFYRIRAGGFRPTAVQQRCRESIERRLSFYGRPPEDLDPERSLKEILKARGLYSQEPSSLATYDKAKLRVCRGDVRPKRAVGVLPALVAAYLRRFKTIVERTPRDLQAVLDSTELPAPYWGPCCVTTMVSVSASTGRGCRSTP